LAAKKRHNGLLAILKRRLRETTEIVKALARLAPMLYTIADVLHKFLKLFKNR
jgi:hypothetical protein